NGGYVMAQALRWIVAAGLLVCSAQASASYEKGRQALASRNLALALQEFRAAGDDAKAEYALGIMHFFGLGVPRDAAQAARLFERSAAKGNHSAQYNYGVLLYRGMGVTKDLAAATTWMEKAAGSGSAQAQNDAGFLQYMTQRTEGGYQKGI